MTGQPDFTDAARAEAERYVPAFTSNDYTPNGLTAIARLAHVEGWKAARTYLTEQEPTHEEVIAATLELYARSHHSTGRQTPFENLAHEEQAAWVEDGRAVLSAAHAAPTRRGEAMSAQCPKCGRFTIAREESGYDGAWGQTWIYTDCKKCGKAVQTTV